MINLIKRIFIIFFRALLPKFIRDELKILRNMSVKKIYNFNLYKDSVFDKNGIEIGGPSAIFQREIPLYRYLKSLDGVNYNFNTVWEGMISEGKNYLFYKKKPIGNQFISEATDLSKIKNESYDFIISSNCLEHSANPLKALVEWKRVLKFNGSLVIVLPKKDSNFDHKRKYTEFSTLLNAYNSDFDESNLDSLDEILSHHDVSLDPGVDNYEDFKNRSLKNFENRCLHHYVFNPCLMKEIFAFINFRLVDIGETKSDYYALAKKIESYN